MAKLQNFSTIQNTFFEIKNALVSGGLHQGMQHKEEVTI